MALLAVMLSGIVLSPFEATVSSAVYILIGAIGIPVFSAGGAGFGVLLGPTGGYLWSYPLLALIASLFCLIPAKNKWIKRVCDLLLANDGVTLKEADAPALYRAVSRATMAEIHPTWRKCADKKKKRVGYLSAEFLLGRAIHSNLYNLGKLDKVKEWLGERGVDFTLFEEIEDAALGNGGLGRLAACYLESGATVGIPLDGYGIRYRYGLFRQTFVNGFQKEEADDWQRCGDPWSYRRESESVEVEFSDFTVRAVPYDTPVIGYGGKTVNTLRLWQSEEPRGFDFEAFDAMQTDRIAKSRMSCESILMPRPCSTIEMMAGSST